MDAFRSAYAHGFARVAACTLPVALAQPAVNAERIAERVRALDAEGVAVAVFPELSLSGYSLDDLHLQDVLLDAVDRAVVDLAEATADCATIVAVGAPLAIGSRVFNCAVMLHRGVVLGVVPKMALPNYREFYELRWFAEGSRAPAAIQRPHWPGADDAGELPCGPDLVVVADDVPGLAIHAEICEDMWVPVPPSSLAALAGATVLLNLSASPITVGRAEDRHLLARSASSRANAVYAYAAASEGESSTDLSWDGMTMVYELGDLLGESQRFPSGPAETIVDVDLDRLRQERMRQGSFDQNGAMIGVPGVREIHVELEPTTADIGLRRAVDRFPFVPDDPARLALDCFEAYNIQVSGLEQRLRALSTDAYQPRIVIGVSGGLDSTHALIVAAKALERLGRPVTDILAFTMPGFATSAGTRSNAIALMEALGVTWEELDIRPVATSLLQTIGHPAGDGEPVYDVAFENVQAGLRTDLLFRIANQRGGIVLGTGDLSELALGWCTYGVGDHMSHYGVNGGIPKTLIQHLIRWVVDTGQFGDDVGAVLTAIVGQEISPELVPQTDEGRMQSTEDAIGPYPLQDFTLFHVLRRGYRPSKIAFLAMHAWGDAAAGSWPAGYPVERRVAYDLPTIAHWLRVFVARFFQHQFKRSALPNGPKVVAGGSLSPRGDWRMPSDASAAAWLAELDAALPRTADDAGPR